MKTVMRDEFLQKSKEVLSSDWVKVSASSLAFAAILNVVLTGAADRLVNEDNYQQACQDFSDKVLQHFKRGGKDGAVAYLISNKDVTFTYPEYSIKQLEDMNSDPPLFHARKPLGYVIEARALLDQQNAGEQSKGYQPVPRGGSKYMCQDDFPLSTTPEYP